MVDYNSLGKMYFSFDKPDLDSSGNPIDVTGNGNNGTAYGATGTPDAILGQGFKFGGYATQDYIEVPNSSDIQLDGDFSLTFFIRFEELKETEQTVISKGSFNAFVKSDNYLYYEIVSNNIKFSFSKIENFPGSFLGSSCVFKNELYISDPLGDAMYKYDGSSITQHSSFSSGDGPNTTFVYDGQLYACCQFGDVVKYWDGSSWNSIGFPGTDPKGFAYYDGKIFVPSYGTSEVYYYDGSSWTLSGSVGSEPEHLAVFNGNLFLAHNSGQVVYKFDGSSWTQIGSFSSETSPMGVYKGNLYVRDGTNIQRYDGGSSWTQVASYSASINDLFVYNGLMYITLLNGNYAYFDGSSWSSEVSTSFNDFYRCVSFRGEVIASAADSTDTEAIFSTGSGVGYGVNLSSGWNHIYLAVDSGLGSTFFYKNGSPVQYGGRSFSFTLQSNSESLLIGKGYGTRSTTDRYTNNGEAHFKGKLDELGIWDSIGDTEVQELYNNGDGYNPFSEYQRRFWDFEDGTLQGWKTFEEAQLKTNNTLGSYSLGIESGSVDHEVALIKPPNMRYKSQIREFSFYYYETSSSNGGGIRLEDPDGNEDHFDSPTVGAVIGVATDNPQWDIWDNNGSEQINSTGYNAWHYVRIVFDWNNGTADIYWEDTSTGSYLEKYDRPLINNTGVNKIKFSTYASGDWILTISMYMWIDNIEIYDIPLDQRNALFYTGGF